MESRNRRHEQNTPPATTTVDRNNGSHNAWGGFIQRTLPPVVASDVKSPDKHSRSRTRSRGSRSRSKSSHSRSHTPSIEYKNRSSKKSHHRERSRTPLKNKKKSRRYSRSSSTSPHFKHRKRLVLRSLCFTKINSLIKRKSSRERDRSDYYSSNADRKDRGNSGIDKYRDRDRRNCEKDSRSSKHHRSYQSRGSNSRGTSHKHRERSRERKR